MFDSRSLGAQEARRRFVLPRLALIFVPLAGLLFSASALSGFPSAHAADSPPRALRLPRSAFPAGAVVKSGPAANSRMDVVSLLHSASFDLLGRAAGYLQSARWTVGKKRVAVTMQYAASIFGSDDQ